MSRGPLRLKNLLQSVLALKRLGQTLSAQQRLLARVQQALPDPAAPHCMAVALKRDQLHIFADSPVWASRLRYSAKILASRLPCAELGIRDIRVGIYFAYTPPKRPQRRPRALSDANSRLLREVAESIDDPQLRASLRRLSRRGRR